MTYGRSSSSSARLCEYGGLSLFELVVLFVFTAVAGEGIAAVVRRSWSFGVKFVRHEFGTGHTRSAARRSAQYSPACMERAIQPERAVRVLVQPCSTQVIADRPRLAKTGLVG